MLGCAVLGALGGAAYAWMPGNGVGIDERVAMTISLAVAGAVTGPVLYATRAWRQRDHVRALLAWTLAGALGGLFVGGCGVVDATRGPVPAMLGTVVGAFLLTMTRYSWWVYLNRGDDDTRSEEERRGQLVVLALTALPVVGILLAAAA